MVQAAEERPPFVCFEVRAIEDRDATIAAGHYVTKDVDYALVTPRGSKDRVERIVAEWFPMLRQEAANGRFPLPWVTAIESGYADWKAGRETPIVGTAIKNWPVISPSQVIMMQQLGIRSVEDLASANEELITRIGMGGRALVQQAVSWLASSTDIGKVTAEISSLKVVNESLLRENTELRKDLQTMAENVKQLQGIKSEAKT